MYLMPSAGNGPMPYGCLVQWHAHTNLCTSGPPHQIDGFTPCAPGSYSLRLHADDDPRLASARVRRSVGNRSLRPAGRGGGDHGSAAGIGSDDQRGAAHLIAARQGGLGESESGRRLVGHGEDVDASSCGVGDGHEARQGGQARTIARRQITHKDGDLLFEGDGLAFEQRTAAAVMCTCTLRPSAPTPSVGRARLCAYSRVCDTRLVELKEPSQFLDRQLPVLRIKRPSLNDRRPVRRRNPSSAPCTAKVS